MYIVVAFMSKSKRKSLRFSHNLSFHSLLGGSANRFHQAFISRQSREPGTLHSLYQVKLKRGHAVFIRSRHYKAMV